MSSGFTLMRVPGGGPARKMIIRHPDGSIEKRPADQYGSYTMEPQAPLLLEGLQRFVNTASKHPHMFMISGAPAPGLDLSKAHVRRWKSEPFTIVDVKRGVLVTDPDNTPVPAPLGNAENIAEAAAYIRDYLMPSEFHGVRCLVSASASTGVYGDNRFYGRLWFPLARPVLQSVLEQYSTGIACAGYPVDPSIARPGQPNYTARPAFIGMEDPVPPHLRAVIIPGSRDMAVEPDLGRFIAVAAAAAEYVEHMKRETGGDWAAFLDQAVGVPYTPGGGVENTFFPNLSAGIGLAARSRAALADVQALVRKLLAERAGSGRRRQYGDGWVARSYWRFAGRDRGEDALADDIIRRIFHGRVPSVDE